MMLLARARRLKKAAAVRSCWLWSFSAAARPWRLAAVNAAASFLQCAGPSGRGTRRGRASGNAACSWQSGLLYPSCFPPTRAPDPALPLSSSRGHQPWLVRCSRSLGTAGAGSSKFTVCLDDVAQTQHVIERFGLRSRVYITEKRFERITSSTKPLPGPNGCTGVGEACTVCSNEKRVGRKHNCLSLEASDLKQ